MNDDEARGTAGRVLTPRTSVADEAAVWDARMRSPDCTVEDRAEFSAWRDRQPANRAAFDRLQLIVASLLHERSRADVRSLREEALRLAPSRRRWVWAAAAAAGVAVMAAGLTQFSGPARWANVPLQAMVDFWQGAQTVETAIGQNSSFMLADGSSIELNAASRVRIVYSARKRTVQLKEGQALFEIAPDARRPFIVEAGNREIRALGTQFDVRLDPRTVQVTLIQGKVRVERSATEEAVLEPGTQLVGELKSDAGTPAATVRKIDVSKVTSWRNGHVFLEDLTLDAAVAEMNKYSPVQIRIGDPSLSSLRVNGMFRAGQQEAFVSALADYFAITSRRRSELQIVLSGRRETIT